MNEILKERFDAVQDIVEEHVFNHLDDYLELHYGEDALAEFIKEFEHLKYCVENYLEETNK